MKGKRIGGFRPILVVLCAAIAATVWSGPAGAVADSMNSRLDSVAKLIEQSSAGRLFEDVEVAEANEKRERARELLAEARKRADEGADPEVVNALLDEATREMLAAVRTVKLEASKRSSIEREYANLADSLDVLTDAYVRISTEQESEGGNELVRLVEEGVTKASNLTEEGDRAAGLEVLKGTYATVQAAIGELRGGETLVRSLHFDTPADEYAYEVDRNDSLRMLVDVLLVERMEGNETLAGQVNAQVEAARLLRSEGESLAASGRHEEAIATLETSTLELIRTIRRAGIYIPQ